MAHNHPTNLKETPLLDELYLTPLSEGVEQNNAEVLPGESLPFYLVIDVKTKAEATYSTLLKTLIFYKDLFYRNEDWVDGPVQLLISGNSPTLDPDASNRISFLDRRIPNIGMGFSSELYPLISDSWFKYFSWDGIGEIPEEELQKLQEYVSKDRQEDKMIRFWGIPDNEKVWCTFINISVEVIAVQNVLAFKKNMHFSSFRTDFSKF